MAFIWNGTTATIAGTAGLKLVDCDTNNGEGKCDVTDSEAATHLYEATLDDPVMTFNVLGPTGLARGDTGETNVNWNDGDANAFGSTVVVGLKRAGSLDNRIVHTVTVVPCREDLT
jgi:hypothetical protein